MGRLTNQRQGTKFLEVWEEGEAFRKLTLKHKEIQVEKEEIEKLKKNRNKGSKIVKKNGLPAVPTDGFSGLTKYGTTNGLLLGMNETSEFDLEESEFNNIDKNE